MSTRSRKPEPGSSGPYRMKDLCARTGLSRQAIHFYIREGLVPEGRKLGRNRAAYGQEHLDRIRLVRQLQHEHFLPLRAIRALIENRDEAFSPAQRRQIAAVKQRLAGTVAGPAERRTVRLRDAVACARVDRPDLDRLVELELLSTTRGPRGVVLMAEEDLWILELWGEVRRAGFTRELGFEPDLLLAFEEAVERVFRKETRLLAGLLSGVPAERVAEMIERALGLIDTFLVRRHRAKAREFFAAIEEDP